MSTQFPHNQNKFNSEDKNEQKLNKPRLNKLAINLLSTHSLWNFPSEIAQIFMLTQQNNISNYF